MPKANGARLTDRLGIDWGSLKRGEPFFYEGTLSGLKNNIARANKLYSPRRFKWERYVYRYSGEEIEKLRVERCK